MLANIIDRRDNEYKFEKVTAIFEPTRNDNSCKGADQAPNDADIVYHEEHGISVADAIKKADEMVGHVTLYLN